jgi:hypothetical protein
LKLCYLAEKAGFEPAVPFRGTHAFQACLFNHSSISPEYSGFALAVAKVVKKRDVAREYYWFVEKWGWGVEKINFTRVDGLAIYGHFGW